MWCEMVIEAPQVPQAATPESAQLALVLAAGRHAVEDIPLERLLSRLSAEKHRLDTLRDPEQPESPSTSVRASLFVSMESLPEELEETLATLAHFDADTSLDLLSSALRLELAECED